MKRLLRWTGGRRGQTLIEFAFIAPIFFVFLFSIVDFGIAIDRRLTLQHAVREGARFGSVHDDIADIQARTEAQAQDLIDPADVDVCYIDADGDTNAGDIGDAVRVSTTFTYEFPIAGEIFGAFGLGPLAIEMTPSGTSRLETQVVGGTAC